MATRSEMEFAYSLIDRLFRCSVGESADFSGANGNYLSVAPVSSLTPDSFTWTAWFKRDVDDVRESASVEVMELLRDWGAEVAYSDPCVPEFPRMRKHAFDLRSVNLTPETLSEFDAVMLLTDHTAFDYAMITSILPC